jgi:DNA-directed RNA polymerase specialized sigma24 family protein
MSLDALRADPDLEPTPAPIAPHRDRVVRYCRRFLGDARQGDAVAHAVLAQARAALARLPADAHVLTWLLTLARHRCLDAIRARA